MYAGSLLGGVRDAERRTEELLSATALAGEPAAWRHALATRATLLDLAELLSASAPIPIDADEGEEDVRSVLDALYRVGPCSPEELRENLPDGGVVERLSAADRIAVVGSRVVVPLDGAPENWPPVVSVLRATLEAVGRDARHVRDRLLVDGAAEDGAVVRAWDGLVGMLEAATELLARLSGYGRYIRENDREDDSGATEFADWTVTQLTE